MKENDIEEAILQKWEIENDKLLVKLEQDERTALEVSDAKIDESWALPPKATKENSLFEWKSS